ncbi:site-specific DNA-methyltransferase (adenine-specific) [Haloarcula quadrata]|uniref:Site-specific DNA-methyltransferase (Adenine-specific) n=1 Tax=Haloarcula quadrata TaxID=182779 RepID=A0A495R522_9EURY|nr:DNA methyltransferase [Haloarcula quadrata]RKS82156.1 site-specific DNA-methyltransferase (adenine-specific) [Haloarcula quadrata]
MTGLLFRSAGDVVSRIRRERGLTDNELAKDADLRVGDLRDIESGVPPTDEQLEALADSLDTKPEALRLAAGEFPEPLQDQLVEDPDRALNALMDAFDLADTEENDGGELPVPEFTTEQGTLYNADCRDVLPGLEDESFDLIFADPPFNLDKDYGEKNGDDLAEDEYLRWSTEWIDEAIDLLKPGGAFFLYNLPKWNVHFAHYISRRLNLKHWIAVDIKFGLPIPNRLYPSHYSLLYFIKGDQPNTFDPDRLPIDTCPHCGGEQNDYGGYKSKMNPEGVNLTDVWDDIPPVRHNKYLNRDANQLSMRLLHRIVGMATEEGDRVLDPFGGAGTTYAAAELMGREWVGTEIHDCSPIIDRFEDGLDDDREYIEEIEDEVNVLFTEDALEKRMRYRDEFNFNFDDYDLSESMAGSVQQSLDSWDN